LGLKVECLKKSEMFIYVEMGLRVGCGVRGG
jgi:hypothetical protein